MAADQPSDARQRSSLTFSLRTLFLIGMTSGVFLAAARWGGGSVLGVVVGSFAVAEFIWIWFSVGIFVSAFRPAARSESQFVPTIRSEPMKPNKPSAEPQPAPWSFLLGTAYMTVGCVGIAAVAFGPYINAAFAVVIAVETLFVGASLTFWFIVTRQFRRMRFTIATLLYIGIPISLLLPATKADFGPRYRPQCSNNLKQLGLALLAYERAYGSFPPAYVADANGKPLYSWRVLILPFLDQGNLAKQIRGDEAWDSPNNAKWTAAPFTIFDCPNDKQPAKSPPALTSYVAVVGPHTAWSGTKPRKLSDFNDPSRTILVVEIANSGIHWAEPRDLYIGQMPVAINPKVGQGISSEHPGGVNAVFADGSVHFLPDTIDLKKLAELLDLDGCNDQSAY